MIDKFLIIKNIRVASIFCISDHFERIPCAEYDIFAIIENRIAFNYLLSAECFLYLLLHLFGSVLHKDSGIRVGLRHFLLSLNKSADHTMRYNNGFILLVVCHLYG